MRYIKDKLGRAKFTPHTQNPTKGFRPNERHVVYMLLLNLHGPLSSEYLYQYTIEKTGNRHNFSEALKALYDGGMVLKPVQQRATEYPDGKYHVYDLTEKGRDYLKAQGLWINAIRPTGNWVHQFMVSTITATIHIMCNRAGYDYVPPHEYLAGKPMKVEEVPFEWEKKRYTLPLAPDAVFAIDYGGGSFIAYALEADRNTEVNVPHSWKRKSDLRSIRQYANFIGKKQYKKAYGREAMMMLLYITVNAGHAKNFVNLLGDELERCAYIAVGVENAFETPFYPPKLATQLFDEPLIRAGKEAFMIKKTT